MAFGDEKFESFFPRVCFSLYLVFYPFLPLPVNTKHHGEKKKQRTKPKPTHYFLFVCLPQHSEHLSKSVKNQCCPKLKELFSVFSRSMWYPKSKQSA